VAGALHSLPGVPGQTLEATALVHEAYLRLVGREQTRDWDGRGHFFAAAAEAMRRILIDRARHKQTRKAGGGHRRFDLDVRAERPTVQVRDDNALFCEALRLIAAVAASARGGLGRGASRFN
jgi:hypothetical protein